MTSYTFKDANDNVLKHCVGSSDFDLEPDMPLPIYAINGNGTQTIVFCEKEFSIVQDSIKFEDQSETREKYTPYEDEEDVEDAFIGKETSIQATIQFPDSCATLEEAVSKISSITWSIGKINDDESITEIEDNDIKDLDIKELDTKWDSEKHQLTITKDDWKPKEKAFGNISVTCKVITSENEDEPIEETNSETDEHPLRIGVTEYDVSLGRATVDVATGGVKTLDGKDIERSFDTDVSTVTPLKNSQKRCKMDREDYDKDFLQETDKKKQWKALVNYLVKNNLVSINGYDPDTNVVKENFAKNAKANQMQMIESLLQFFSDYHFYILLGKETDNSYATSNGKILNPESDIMRTIYVPSLAETTDYSASDANVEIMARTIAYVDWQNLSNNKTQPGSLVIYSRWAEASDIIKGGGEIILTPYIVTFAKVTPGVALPSSNFQGYGLMNGMYSADECKDNFFISRGTELNKLADILTDATNEGVGYHQYQAARTDVLNWISNLQNSSVTLTGHSLGGALSQWFASGCAEQGIISKIKKITTFNSAAISSTAADKFNNRDNGIDIDHYVSNGDIVSFAGENFIGKGNIVHLIMYRLEYTNKEGKSVDQRGRLVDENGYVYKKNNDGSLEKTEEYGDFGLGYKHGMWLANTDWRGEFSSTTKEIPLILKLKGINKIQYITLGNLKISIDTLNSYWLHWTQTGYLGPLSIKIIKSSFVRGTTEQTRYSLNPIGNTFFTGFDANSNKRQDKSEWWLSGINKNLYFQKHSILVDITHNIFDEIPKGYYPGLTTAKSNATYGTADLSTLSGMKLTVVLEYEYIAERAPSSTQDCLLNHIYVKKAKQGTKLGKLFTLAEDTCFTFISSAGYDTKMNNGAVELKADVLKLNGMGVIIAGNNYSEKTDGSSLVLTSLTFHTGAGDVSSITANVSGKKINFDYSKTVTKAKANADLVITLKTQEVLRLTNAKISFGEKTNEITATSGTFKDKLIKSAKLVQSKTPYGVTWKVSEIITTDGEYKYVGGEWKFYKKNDQDISSNFGFQSSSPAPAMELAVCALEAMAAPAATVDTRVLAFNWTNPVENPNLVFKVGNTVYTESEMISNGNLLLYTKSDTSRSYIIKNSSANVNTWRFNSNEILGLVQVALQTFEGDITSAQVTSVNTVVSNGSKVNITFTAENMTEDSLVEMAVRQTGQTEDILDFYVPVSEMPQTSGGYSYTFDLADYDLTTGDYQIFAWSDESMRENAVASGFFHVTIQSHLVLSQTSLQFANTNAMQESAAKQMTITNTGNGKSYFTLSLANSEEITGADFSISGTYSNGEEIALDCIELAAGESITLDIQFTPQSEGAKSWTVELLDADTSEKCGEFTISGTGLAMLKTEVTILADNSSLTTTSIAAGDPLYVSGTLKNTGNNVSDAITVSLYASQNSNALSSGVLLGSYEGIVLEGQSEETIPFYVNSTIDLSVGNWYLGFVVDCSNDTIKSNNKSVFSNYISILPSSFDLVLTNVSAIPVDLNNNGLYDILNISGTINVETAGTYTIVWVLWDNDSQDITEVSQEYSLRAGTNTVTANLNGYDISRYGVDGPYSLSARVISNQCVWYNSDLYVTNTYTANQFEETQIIEYSANDIACILTFLEQTDSNGVKNGTKLNSNYNVNNISTWTGVTWTNIDGIMRATAIELSNKQLTGPLDLSGLSALTELLCTNNQLTSINVSQNTALTRFMCYGNQLTELNVSGCTSLTTLKCHRNQLTELNIENNLNLTLLECTTNLLTELNVSANTALTDLYCAANKLTALNLANNTALKELRCGLNPLKGLDLSKNTALTALNCHDCTLTTLDVSYCTLLTKLECFGNPVSTLDLSKNTALTSLIFWNSKLSKVVLPSRRTKNISLSLAAYSQTNWTFKDANNTVLGTSITNDSTNTSYAFPASVALPISATNAAGTQTVTFTDSSMDLTNISINGNKVTVSWEDDSPMADAVRYRAEGTTKWTVKKLKAGVTTFTFNATVGTNYEIEILLDQQEDNILRADAVVLDQPKLAAVKTSIVDDAFQVNVTNYTAKNLATEAKQAILTVNGVQTTLNIANQQGSAALTNGGNVTFANCLFTFTGMNSNTSYKVQVSFSDGISDSKVSSALTVKTTKAPYLVPNIVSATTISDTSVEVKWATSYGKNTTQAAAAYTVQYSVAGTNKWSNATTKAIGNSFIVTKLKGGTSYEFRVFATKDNTFLASGFSNALTATTFPSAPKIASLVSKTAKTAVLTWNVPTGVQKFDLRYCLKGTNNWQTVTVMATGEAKMSYTFIGLTSGMAYEFQVRAIDARLNTSAWTVSKVLTKVL